MAKGLCPGVGWSHGKESVEKRGRERKRPIFFGLRGKPIKLLHRTCTAPEGIGHPLEKVWKAWAGKWAQQASMLRRTGHGEWEGTSTSRVLAPKMKGKGLREGEVLKKNETRTLQEQIIFNEARRGSSQISKLLHQPKKRVSIYRQVCGKLLS